MMRLYLDLCCFNRPFDDQSQTRIRLATEAKLALQEHARSGRIEIIWSYILDFENDQNPFLERAESIGAWRAIAADRVSESDTVLAAARQANTAGGGLPGADVNWQVNTSPGAYSPPNWPDFTFANQRYWWYFDYTYQDGGLHQTQTLNGKTDSTGTHYLELDFKAQGDPENGPQPYSVFAYGTVMDVNRQSWTSSSALLVHPADVYIGLRTPGYFVERGAPLDVDFIVTDLDGNPAEGREVVITAGILDWKFKDGNWVEEVVHLGAAVR